MDLGLILYASAWGTAVPMKAASKNSEKLWKKFLTNEFLRGRINEFRRTARTTKSEKFAGKQLESLKKLWKKFLTSVKSCDRMSLTNDRSAACVPCKLNNVKTWRSTLDNEFAGLEKPADKFCSKYKI